MDTLLCNSDGDVILFGAPSATDEVLAFHYGNFDNHYGDGTVGAAAANGRVYADTVPATLPTKFGTIGTPSTASGQTTYSWTPPSTSLNANVLIVAGGGGGGSDNAGGGGGGGLIFSTGVAISGTQTIKVGNGGVGAFTNGTATNGYNSEAFGSIAIGGGGGGTGNPGILNGLTGGSGGGGASEGTNGTGGAGTSGQGNNGGNGFSSSGGGGGGAGSAGTDAVAANSAGNGGSGVLMGVYGETYGQSGWFAGGAGGGVDNSASALAGTGIGGIGGGGDGGRGAGESGIPHTGGGGGGANYPGASVYGGNGGSGIVLIRYIVDNAIIAAKVGVFNYVSSSEYTSTSLTLYSNDTSGDWVTVYDITNPSRDGSGRVQYSLNNSLALNSYPYTRIGYLLTHTFPGQSTIDWVFCTFDKWSSTITDLRVPDLVDAFTNQRNVTNLNVYSSNQTAQPNRNNVSGRLEIWPYNYGTTQSGLAPAGSNTQYDYDDTSTGSSGYGSFQCHDVTNGVTCLAWNNHNSVTPCVGIGNNVSGNPFYDSGGHFDWTFADNYNSDFNLKIMVM